MDAALQKSFARFGISASLIVLAFAKPLTELVRYAASNDLSSYVLCIPFLVPGLIWINRAEISWPRPSRSARAGLVFLILGSVLLVGAWGAIGQHLSPLDLLSLRLVAFVLLLFGTACFFFGLQMLRATFLPAALLFCLIPLPSGFVSWAEEFLQYTSAVTASAFFAVSGTPAARQGMVLHLSTIHLEVGRECSGIRSTLVLLLTSVIAGYLFLRSPWRRLGLMVVVIPLGILRNAFRIFFLGMLCVHVSPALIHSWIHRQGGPIFFAGSLVPFVALLYLLQRGDRRSPGSQLNVAKAGPSDLRSSDICGRTP